MTNKRFSGKIGEEYELFSLVCPHFDEFEGTVGKTIREHYRKSSKEAITVLELGCGTGYTTSRILASDERTRVVAVDDERIMIEQAQSYLDDYIEQDRLELTHADGLEYLQSMPSNSIDVFASAFTLHNFNQEYRHDVIKEIMRVLKPRGLFVNADKYARDGEDEHSRDLNWQLQQFKDMYAAIGRPDLSESWTSHYLEDNQPDRIMREGTAKKQMQAIGFKQVKTIYRNRMEAIVTATT